MAVFPDNSGRNEIPSVSVISDRVLARHEHASGGSAHWSTRVVLRKTHAFRCQAIQVRGANFILSVAAQLSVAKIISVYVNNIWQL